MKIKNLSMLGAAICILTYITNSVFGQNAPPGGGELHSITTGSYDSAYGYDALYYDTTGGYNTACGAASLYNNTNGNLNTAVGYYALLGNLSGGENTAVGCTALFYNTTGGNNVGVGVNAGYHITTGSQNVALGVNAGEDITTGSNNVALGYQAGQSITTGSNNVALGYQAGQGIVNGTNNVALGYNAGLNVTTGNNNIDIGNTGVPGDSEIIRIGADGTNTDTYIAGISGTAVTGSAVYVTTSGQLGVAASSRRYKENIQSMGDVSDKLLSLHPVKFQYRKDLDFHGTPQFGLVAEEVNEVDPDLVIRDAKNQVFSVRYEAVNAMLLNEFLKEHRRVEDQKMEIATLKEKAAELDSLEKRFDELQKSVEQLAKAK